MRLGFVCGINEPMFRFAKQAGFEGLEVMAGIWEGQGDQPTRDTAKRARALLDTYGLKALTVQWAEDYCQLKNPVERLKQFVAFAHAVDTRIIAVNAWVPGGLSVAERFDYYQKLWSQFAPIVEDSGLKLVIENCPHGGRNLGNCPASLRRMFELVPSMAIGLEFDPSHFIFQFMDYLAPIYEFGTRLYAFHAKDTQILHGRMNEFGTLGDQYLNESWWRFRVPGYGDVDWRKVFVALSDIGYLGDIIIEHEDPVFGSEDGLTRASRFLRNYVF